LGHAIEMAEGSSVSIELYYEKLLRMKGVDDCLKQRTIPDATFRNWNSYSSKVKFEKGVNVMEAFTLLPDPQTNGGLLIAAAPEFKNHIENHFIQNGLQDFITPIGRVIEPSDKTIHVH
jgi:selenide,water dikinase